MKVVVDAASWGALLSVNLSGVLAVATVFDGKCTFWLPCGAGREIPFLRSLGRADGLASG